MLNPLSLLDETVNKACSNRQGDAVPGWRWGSFLKYVSRVRRIRRSQRLWLKLCSNPFEGFCLFPQESLLHTDSLESVKLGSEKQSRQRIIMEDHWFQFHFSPIQDKYNKVAKPEQLIRVCVCVCVCVLLCVCAILQGRLERKRSKKPLSPWTEAVSPGCNSKA